MVAIALSVIIDGIKSRLNPASRVVPQPVALIGAGIASVIMLVVWYMNRQTGLKLKNAALLASAQDSLSDAFTSIGTLISIGGALLFNLRWLDGATSIVVGFFFRLFLFGFFLLDSQKFFRFFSSFFFGASFLFLTHFFRLDFKDIIGERAKFYGCTGCINVFSLFAIDGGCRLCRQTIACVLPRVRG